MCKPIQGPRTSYHVISSLPFDSPRSDSLGYTEKAKESAMSARKKKWICFCIFLIILIIIGVVVGIQVAQGNIGNIGKKNDNSVTVTATATATPSGAATSSLRSG
jgi:hypothetical protein